MVRPVNSSSSSAGGVASKRKRLDYDDATGSKSSKKRYNDTISKSPERAQTPGTKNARFAKGKNLIKGATPAEPVSGRAQTPSHSNLRKPSDPSDAATAQLQAEERASEERRATSRPVQGRPRQASPTKHSPMRLGSTGLTQGLADINLGKDFQRNGASATKSRQAVNKNKVDAKANGLQTVTVADFTLDSPRGSYSVFGNVCEKVNDIRRLAQEFAWTCPRFTPNQCESLLDHLLQRENEKLVKYIGCLAISGPMGKVGWKELIGDLLCRRALVLGIVGRALKEHVFDQLYFGGSTDLIQKLDKKQKDLVHLDGFYRTTERAILIGCHKPKKGDDSEFSRAVATVALQLQKLLLPLWQLHPDALGPRPNLEQLAEIVSAAGMLSREFRETPDVVFYWPPTFKDEEFEPGRMECLNLREMISTSPYDKQEIGGFERAVLRADQEDRSEAIVRIVCFPGLVAYRQNGGELADQELADEDEQRIAKESREKVPPDVKKHRRLLQSQEQKSDRDDGFRTCLISKSVVWLRWGKQRLLTKEAGTSRHIDAMKTKNGMEKYKIDSEKYKELYDLWKEKNPGAQTNQGLLRRMWQRSPSLPP